MKTENKWKGSRWQVFDSRQRNYSRLKIGTSAEILWKEMSAILWQPAVMPQDYRVCELCARRGDGVTEVCGRLLNMDADRWVHINCALWSAEVYETMDGGLVNVEQAVRRASTSRCCRCDQPGATVPCYKLRCGNNYHLQCAVESRCTFMIDKVSTARLKCHIPEDLD
ncbi:unnamed protein product [Soboliphyme baturini]|uniref:PHD-type domain-containing protein n=1 Tax=Soboliphyme baturini TaxID=241478 RepID=A0A183IG89_9BILA|nr:unnamed protein product [Soboliphyme baturini]